MSAARFDIEIEEHSDLSKEFTYRDDQGDPNDVTNWGATVIFAESYNLTPFYRGDSDDSDAPVIVGGTNGIIELQVPYTHFQNLDLSQGVWELYIYPTVGDITDRPKRLIYGTFEYKKSLL